MIRFHLLFIITLAFGVSHAVAQIPDEFINLQVLPKDVSKAQLVDTMKSFTRALGVRCEHCHVGKAGESLSTFDFASDSKETKKISRVMLKMVQDINTNYLSKLEKPEATKVRCATCHHGLTEPEALEDRLMKAITRDGVEAAVKEYHDLKGKYYGSYAYDFSEKSLNQVGMQLLSQKKPQPAIRFLKLNTEENPGSLLAHLYLAQAYEQNGEQAEASKSLEKALALDPGNDDIKKQIQELKNVKKE